LLARIEGSKLQANYLAVDAPVLDASQFQTFRVRFQVHNAGAVPITSTPQLEYRADGGAGFAVVPEKAQPGIALHVAREWVPSLGLGGGTKQGPLGEDIAVGDLRIPSAVGVAAVGHHSMGANPDAPITLPAASYTEQEFTVGLTIDARYLTGYELRITDGGTALTGAQVARIVLGPQPEPQLSAGQRQGVDVVDPTATNAAGVVYPLLSAPTIAADTTSGAAAPAVDPANAPRFALDSGSLSPATVATSTSVTVAVTGPAAVASSESHTATADQCGACHRGHTAQGPNLLAQSRQSTLCFSCHDGLGATKDVQSQYALARPVNDPVNRDYYSHDALAPSTHTRADLDEFGGVSNRHSECADCHNSHKVGSTDSKETLDGWDASGRLAGVSGVSVVNGAAGAAPTYKFLNGVTDLVTREYQLCFKCHSGSTVLTSNAGLKPSQYALDKGVEFNPNNPSFHPVEAAGTNKTAKMDLNLAGTSPYKLWNFNTGSTIRCLNCHASGTTPDTTPTPTPTPLPLPGSALEPHTSSNRGILLENYQDRVLKSASDAYGAKDFALCYVCHGEEPFKTGTGNGATDATNFKLHGKHLTGLAQNGLGGTDIDKAGDGQGNAICAECHFRIHSTTDKVGPQVIPGSRLLNFAPNVQPSSGTLSWTPGATGGGSCTLTCHGYTHDALTY
jgi:predicted CXXCH cytochrome family protein